MSDLKGIFFKNLDVPFPWLGIYRGMIYYRFTLVQVPYGMLQKLILPGKLTCPLKINGWKMHSLLKLSLFKGTNSFVFGCVLVLLLK